MTSPVFTDVAPLEVLWLLYIWQEDETRYRKNEEGHYEPYSVPAHWKLFRKDGISENLVSGYLTFDTAMKAAKAVCYDYGEQRRTFRIAQYYLQYAGSMTRQENKEVT